VILVELGPAFFNKIMKNVVGLGRTGEMLLVGSDLLLRADSRHVPDNSVMKLKIDTLNAQRAVSGVDGVGEAIDFRGQKTLAAYGPLDVRTIRWGIIAKQDIDEITAPIQREQQAISSRRSA